MFLHNKRLIAIVSVDRKKIILFCHVFTDTATKVPWND